MTKKSIICGAAAILAALLPYPGLRGDVTVYGHFRLRTEHSGGADCAQLRLAAKKIESLLRRERSLLPGGKNMLIFTGAREFRLIRSAKLWTLCMPGNSRRWERDFQLRRQLYGCLLAARLEISPAENPPQLSEWLTTAIDRSITNSKGSELFLANNGNYVRSAQFFRYCGKLPDFAAFCTMKWQLLSPSVRTAADEFALLLAELLARRKLLIFQISSDLNGGAPDAWASRFTDGGAKRQRSLETDAWQIVWNSRQPLPPELTEQRIAAISDFAIPELGVNGKPTGKILFCSPAEAARKLDPETRRDAAALRRAFAVPWNELARECDAESQSLCRKIAASITLFGIESKAPENYSDALDKLKKHTEQRRRQEKFLDRTEREHLPIPCIFGAKLNALDNSNPALTTPDKIFLLLAERDYLNE